MGGGGVVRLPPQEYLWKHDYQVWIKGFLMLFDMSKFLRWQKCIFCEVRIFNFHLFCDDLALGMQGLFWSSLVSFFKCQHSHSACDFFFFTFFLTKCTKFNCSSNHFIYLVSPFEGLLYVLMFVCHAYLFYFGEFVS